MTDIDLRVQPRMLFIIFVCCDLLNLILQGIGGGVCSTEQSPYGIQAGINIVIAGLATQVTSLLLFMACCAHFSWRVYRFPERKVKECQGVRESARFHQFLIGMYLLPSCLDGAVIDCGNRSRAGDSVHLHSVRIPHC